MGVGLRGKEATLWFLSDFQRTDGHLGPLWCPVYGGRICGQTNEIKSQLVGGHWMKHSSCRGVYLET